MDCRPQTSVPKVFSLGSMPVGDFLSFVSMATYPGRRSLSFQSSGTNETGAVLEQSIQLTLNGSLSLTLRRVVVRLKHPTRDGDLEIAILSNLPLADASAVKIAALYQKRWRVERLFQVLDQCFRGEIDTLAYPRAALFGFCMALICYNVLAVLKAAMRSVHWR